MAQIPHADEGLVCPLHKCDVSQVCHKCPLWVQVRGKHPQSEQEINEWKCALAWLPILMIENSQMQRQTGAAVESFRNEMVQLNGSHAAVAAAGTNALRSDSDRARTLVGLAQTLDAVYSQNRPTHG